MKNKIIYVIGIIILTLGCWLTAYCYFGSIAMSFGGIIGLMPVWLVVFALLSWLFTTALAASAKRVNTKVWIAVGLLILALWFLPAPKILEIFPIQEGEPFGTPLAFMLLGIISIALITTALLINSSLRLYKTRQNTEATENGDSKVHRNRNSRRAAAALALSMLLLAGAFYKFYWFMIWDTTYDGLGYLWLPVPFLAVLSSGLMLFTSLPEKTKLAVFFYLLLIPALIAISFNALQVDFRQLTEERADRVSREIESYYARKGHYPENLQQLTPWYMRSIPGPVIIYGQNWCYDGGDNYYRFGYIDREHWSAPHFIGRTYQTKGEVPDLHGMCEKEAVALQKRYPDFPYEYRVEGK